MDMNKGFFTIEMLIAIGLLSIFSAALVSYHILSVYWQAEAIKRSHALMIISSFIDSFQLSSQKESKGTFSETDIQITWNTERIEYAPRKNVLLNELIAHDVFLLSVQAQWNTIFDTQKVIKVETVIV